MPRRGRALHRAAALSSAIAVSLGGLLVSSGTAYADLPLCTRHDSVGPDGTVVGLLYNTPTAAYQTSDDTVVELPGVLDPAVNINYDNAEAISADGSLIAGTAYAGAGANGYNTWKAVTWTCG